MRPCTPTQDVPAPRESAFKSIPHPAAPVGEPSQTRRQAKIGACTDPPTPVARRHERAGARLSGLFFWTVHGPFLFWQDRKGPPPRPARWGEEEQGSGRSFRRRRKRS